MMDAHYQVLAEAVVTSCGDKFDLGQIIATVEDDNSEIEVSCQKNKVESFVDPGAQLSWDVHRSLSSIRKDMTIPGQKPWSKCKFTLFPDGTFKFDVEYED
jgi:hypothetical protein